MKIWSSVLALVLFLIFLGPQGALGLPVEYRQDEALLNDLWLKLLRQTATNIPYRRQLRAAQRDWMEQREALVHKYCARGMDRDEAELTVLRERIAAVRRELRKIERRPEDRFDRLTEDEYDHYVRWSPAFRRTEALLERQWRKLMHLLEGDPRRREALRENQRAWVRSGRDASAKQFILQGMLRERAYVRAAEERVRFLNAEIARLTSPEDVPRPGRFKPLDEEEYQLLMKTSPAFREAEQALNIQWAKVRKLRQPPQEAAALLNEQRQWLVHGRDEKAWDYVRAGIPRDLAYAKAVAQRTKYLAAWYEKARHAAPPAKENPKPAANTKPAPQQAPQPAKEKPKQEREKELLRALEEIDL